MLLRLSRGKWAGVQAVDELDDFGSKVVDVVGAARAELERDEVVVGEDVEPLEEVLEDLDELDGIEGVESDGVQVLGCPFERVVCGRARRDRSPGSSASPWGTWGRMIFGAAAVFVCSLVVEARTVPRPPAR
jgi:hypothetical protein